MNGQFVGDENDCAKFYRCVDDDRGGFSQVAFSCGPGTVWDAQILACNHNWAVKDKSCHNAATTARPVGSTTTPQPSQSSSQSPRPTTSSTTQTPSTTVTAQTTNGVKCKSEGFIGDPNSCAKFYRCVDNGKGGFDQIPFHCAAGTVWDQNLQTCNHDLNKCNPNNVNNSTTESDKGPCTTTPTSPTTNSPIETSTDSTTVADTTTAMWSTTVGPITTESQSTTTMWTTTLRPSTTVAETTTESTMWTTSLRPSTTVAETTTESTMWTTTLRPSTTVAETTTESTMWTTTLRPSTTVAETTTESTMWTTTLRPSTTVAETTTIIPPTTTTPVPNLPPGTECTGNGFMADPNNCRKFYRCVNHGGSYSKHEFMCAKNTAWNEDLQTCDHVGNVPRCAGQTDAPTTTQPTTEYPQQSTTVSSEDPTKPTTAYPTKPTDPPTKPTTTEYPTKPTEPTMKPTTEYPTKPTESTMKPTTEYPTKPTDSTINPTTEYPTKPTDSTMKPTDYPTKPTDSTAKPTTTEYPTKPTDTTTDYYPETTTIFTTSKPGYNPTTSELPTTTTEVSSGTTLQPEPEVPNFNCTSEGFHADPQDCSIYYRCTKYNNSYQVYKFRCPKGTVWDSSLETCNYADQVSSGNCSSGSSASTTPSGMATQAPWTSTTERVTTVQPETTTTLRPVETTTSAETTTSSTLRPVETTTTTEITTTSPVETTTTTEITTTSSTLRPVETTTTTQPIDTTTEQQNNSPQPSNNSTAPCPQTSEEQSLFVCPSGFRRHPKQCSMFYQCNENTDSNLNIVMFQCPNGTVYHEKSCRCANPEPNDSCTNKGSSRTQSFEEAHPANTVQIHTTSPLCPEEGHFALNQDECSEVFVKCGYKQETARLEGQIYRCPQGFAYWNVSRRCEPARKLTNCTPASYSIGDSVPLEWVNLGYRRRSLRI
ncbi:hypothetical protein ACLKA6_000538 [Drosophila palustris]